jgi:hypothetical protein
LAGALKALRSPARAAAARPVHHGDDAGEHHQQGATTADVKVIKVMPRGYLRDHPEMQVQILDLLLESWDEASDETRREFFLILNGRDEFMPVVNATMKAAAESAKARPLRQKVAGCA